MPLDNVTGNEQHLGLLALFGRASELSQVSAEVP